MLRASVATPEDEAESERANTRLVTADAPPAAEADSGLLERLLNAPEPVAVDAFAVLIARANAAVPVAAPDKERR